MKCQWQFSYLSDDTKNLCSVHQTLSSEKLVLTNVTDGLHFGLWGNVMEKAVTGV